MSIAHGTRLEIIGRSETPREKKHDREKFDLNQQRASNHDAGYSEEATSDIRLWNVDLRAASREEKVEFIVGCVISAFIRCKICTYVCSCPS